MNRGYNVSRLFEYITVDLLVSIVQIGKTKILCEVRKLDSLDFEARKCGLLKIETNLS